MRLWYSFLIFFPVAFLSGEQSNRFVIQGAQLTLINPETQQSLPLSVEKVIVTVEDGVLLVNKKKLRLPLVILKSETGVLSCNDTIKAQSVALSSVNSKLCSCVPYTIEMSEKKESQCIVKVLLHEEDEYAVNQWHIVTDGTLCVLNPEDSAKKKIIKDKSLYVLIQDGALYLNGKRYNDDTCMIMSSDYHFSLNDVRYHGVLCIKRYQNVYMLINYIPLEEYLCSVLQSESWPGWPLEVNKVFAITSRSYAIAMILSAKKNDKPYHIKNTNIHQTYRGVHTHKKLKDAVDQTRGIFLSYNNYPITAMFDSCCGGIVPAHIHGPDFIKAPYLARSYPCTYCKGCKLFNWHAEYDVYYLVDRLKSINDSLDYIKGLKIAKKDKAGLVQEILVKGNKASLLFSGKQWYSCFKEVKSFCFSVQHKSNKIIVKGKGYGHHIGLCQWGAREMVRQGWNYKSILQFYYPGTTFMKLS